MMLMDEMPVLDAAGKPVVDEKTGLPVVTIEPRLDRRSNEPIITEDRALSPYRALPRASRDRLLGNPAKDLIGYETSGVWLPKYQQYDNGMMVGLKCWKCRRELAGWMPALRRIPNMKPDDPAELVNINGKPAVRFTPYNHYREGQYRYRRPDGIFGTFSYLHCADCFITDADGEALLDCFLAGHDYTRETLRLFTDDYWAQWMWRWSAIALIGRDGASLGPGDLIKEAMAKKV